MLIWFGNSMMLRTFHYIILGFYLLVCMVVGGSMRLRCADLKDTHMVVFFLVHYISFLSLHACAFETKFHLCFFTEICLKPLYYKAMQFAPSDYNPTVFGCHSYLHFYCPFNGFRYLLIKWLKFWEREHGKRK